MRDAAAERHAIERLRAQLDLLPGRRTTFAGGDAPRFVEKLKRWRGDLSGRAAGIVKPTTTLAARLTVGTDPATEAVRFDLTFVPEGPAGAGKSEAKVDAAAVVRAWQEGLGLVPLDGGGWAALPLGWLEKHGQRVADLLAARAATTASWRSHALPALAALCDELEHPPPPGLERLAPLVERLRAAARARRCPPI